jgi:acyl-CoA thioesterase I
MRFVLTTLIFQFALLSSNLSQTTIKFLALGDSYTIGESLPSEQNWPNQLANRLETENKADEVETTIIAKTGWRTDDLINAMNQATLLDSYDLVSLSIGVNNQYQHKELDQYIEEFETLLKKAVELSGNRPKRVFVLSIPDYYYTPFGKLKGDKTISAELKLYNRIARSHCEKYGVSFLNITPISEKGIEDFTLVARDELHPSAKQYKLWVDLILETKFK